MDSDTEENRDRRRFLAHLASLSALGLSGCIDIPQQDAVSREEFERLRQRVDELERETPENSGAIAPNVQADLEIKEDPDRRRIEISVDSSEQLESFRVRDPFGNSVTVQNPGYGTAIIEGTDEGPVYVPGETYTVIGVSDGRESVIGTYEARGPSEGTGTDDTDDTDESDGPTAEVNVVKGTQEGTGIIELQFRSVNLDSVTIETGTDAVRLQDLPSPPFVVRIGQDRVEDPRIVNTELDYVPGETYVVTGEKDGTREEILRFETEG
jgi:hypothetical protein